nr:hypothetical protein [Tanacetum cinerariifolium]
MDYKQTKDYLPRVHHSRQIDEELRDSYRTLEKSLFHEGRIVTPSFIAKNDMLPFFQAIALSIHLYANSISFISNPYNSSRLRNFYTSEWLLNSLDDHPNSNYFVPKHNIIKNAITTHRTTQAQLIRDPNKLYIDDIRPDLKGWELFFKQILFYSIDKRNKVKAFIAYMLYYLTIRRKFNFSSMIIYRMEEVIKKRKGPMPFAMLLTRLYNHILETNPQAIVPIARFIFHEHFMDPLDISRNPSTKKGKKFASPSVISSSSSSSDDNKAPSLLEFYDELS